MTSKSTVKAPQFNINKQEDVDEALKLDTPTIRYRDGDGWLICNTSLGCGSLILQGWSSGIGIASDNEQTFDKKLFHLLYLSKMDNRKYVKSKWDIFVTGKSVEAPIGVPLNRHQFLEVDHTYTLNSLSEWVKRFEAFVIKHDLGQISLSHPFVNRVYRRSENITAVWTWNGKVPKAADVGITDWKLPE